MPCRLVCETLTGILLYPLPLLVSPLSLLFLSPSPLPLLSSLPSSSPSSFPYPLPSPSSPHSLPTSPSEASSSRPQSGVTRVSVYQGGDDVGFDAFGVPLIVQQGQPQQQYPGEDMGVPGT